MTSFVSGIGFTVLTHDNRLNLGLVVDKAILPSKEDAQKICNGVFIHIELLFLEMFGNGSHTNGNDQLRYAYILYEKTIFLACFLKLIS